MDELLKLLKVEALDESDQEVLKSKLEMIVEAKAQEKVEKLVEEEKTKLVAEYEEKFEAYKEDIVSKFSDFVDQVIDEELVIPDHIVEYARKGELYEDVIEQLKLRIAVDEGILDDEAKDIMSEAKEEILNLRGQLDESIAENLEAKSLLSEARSELYKNELCEGLTFKQKAKVMPLLEGISDLEEMDRKFAIISEAILLESDDDDDDGDEMSDEDKDKKKKKKKDHKEPDGDECDEDTGKKGKGSEEVTLTEDDQKTKDFFSKFLEAQRTVLKSM
ncbi:MAG: hypothetical protein VB122_00315 [Erysipelotrichales bacterium]|nr:hypothetical protein [Erysipelotrichales bacterium]